MIRLLLWVFFIYIAYKVVEAIISPTPPRSRPRGTSGPGGGASGGARKKSGDFSNIEDAEFEDLTPKKPPETKEP